MQRMPFNLWLATGSGFIRYLKAVIVLFPVTLGAMLIGHYICRVIGVKLFEAAPNSLHFWGFGAWMAICLGFSFSRTVRRETKSFQHIDV